MKILAISDLHIQAYGDEAYSFFKNFTALVSNSDATDVILLGDIFDVMVGAQKGYLKDYQWYFDEIATMLAKGINVHFLEGNHDFHLDLIFDHFIQKNNFPGKFTYSKKPIEFYIADKKVLFMHGDDLDLDNPSYQQWKSIYTSTPFRIVVNHLLPYAVAKWLGKKASTDSKQRNRKNFDYESFKLKYREKAQKYLDNNPNIDVLVAGHTHIKDKCTFEDRVYLNAGYPRIDQSYICISEDVIEVQQI